MHRLKEFKFLSDSQRALSVKEYIYNTGISIYRNVTLSYVEMFQMFPSPLDLSLNVLIFYLYSRVVYLDRVCINCHREDPDGRVNFPMM